MKRLNALLALVTLAFTPLSVWAAPPRESGRVSAHLSAADQAFLNAREVARVGDSAGLAQYASRLADYPLSAYIEYWRLLAQVRSGAPIATPDIAQFSSTLCEHLYRRSV